MSAACPALDTASSRGTVSGERAARRLGRDRDVRRDEQRRPQLRIRVEAGHDAVVHHHREPAEHGGGRVVGVALELGRDLEDRGRIQAETERRVRERDAGHGGGGRGAQAALERDPVAAADRGGGSVRSKRAAVSARARDTRSDPSVGSSSAPSPSHVTPGSASVSIVTSLHRSSASPKQSNPGPRFAEVAGTVAVSAHRYSPSSAATASASAGTVVGAAPPLVAHSGSFSP